MAGELPYFKFYASEWMTGTITLCSMEAQGVFVNLCTSYWLKKGELSYAIALRRYSNSMVEELVKEGIIHVEGDKIVIKFLDEQLQERDATSEKYRQNAQKRWSGKATEKQLHATAKQSDATAHIREENRREEKRKEENRREESSRATRTQGTKSRSVFEKPSMENLQDYFFEQLQDKETANQEAQNFYDYYVANGWKIGGKSPMKNWHAAVRNWVRRMKDKPKQHGRTDKFSEEAVKSRMDRW